MRRRILDGLLEALALGAAAVTALAITVLATGEGRGPELLLADGLALLVLVLLLAKLRAERRARRADAGFRLLAENSGDMVTRLAPDGTVLYASPASAELCGLAPEEVLGRPLALLVHPDDRPALEGVLRDPPAAPVTVRLRVLRRPGGWRWAEAAVRGVDDGQGGAEVHAALRDVQDAHEAQEQLRAQRDRAEELAASLEQHRAELAARNLALTDLADARARGQARAELLYATAERVAAEREEREILRVGMEGMAGLLGATGATAELHAVPGGEAVRVAMPAGPRAPVADPGEAPVAVPIARGSRVIGRVLLRPGPHPPEAADTAALAHLAGHLAVAVDRSRALRAAVRQAGITRAVLDATPDAIHLVDADGLPVLANRPFAAGLVPLLGPCAGMDAEAPEWLGAVADPARFLADAAALRADDGLEAVHEIALADGRTLVRYSGPVHDREGAMVGRLFVHRDVSAEREAERAKDEFLALVSHELRTPLTSVIGYLELLLDGEAGPLVGDQRRFTEVAERNARRLLRLVGDLLVVAQAEAGRLGLATGPVDLEALALERIEAARPAAEAAGVALAARGEPVLVDGDRGRLGQVIDNLLGNAVRHTPAGGAVRLEVALRDGTALVEVADSGPGIPAAELPHVFGRFWRGRGAHGTAGSGLGLAICQLIGEAHGGTVEAASPPGGGAVMRLRLPSAPAPPYPAGSSAPADAPAAILRAT